MNAASREPAEILVVDANPLELASIVAPLDAAGHIVHQAQDRLTTLQIARRQALDLIICDVNVGADDGLALSREMRQIPGMEDVPRMFVSRTQLPDIVRRSHEAGAAYYLRKPIDPEVLVDLVGKALWLPHLVHTRLSRHEPVVQAVPAPRARISARAAAIQGIRLPLA